MLTVSRRAVHAKVTLTTGIMIESPSVETRTPVRYSSSTIAWKYIQDPKKSDGIEAAAAATQTIHRGERFMPSA